MIRVFKYFSAVLLLPFLLSFTNKENTLAGTYGVSENDPNYIELTLNEDYSFAFKDYSDSENKIAIEGTWSLVRNKVVLLSENNTEKYHDKWKISNNGLIAKSRKGFAFYSLHKKSN